MTNLYYQDPEDEDDSSNDEADDFSFDFDDPIVKGEDEYPDIS